jgi:hypothetical protein
MDRRKKRIILIVIAVLILAVVVVVGKRRFPFSRLFKAPSTPETEFVNQKLINSLAPNSLYFDFEVDPKATKDNRLYKGIAHSGQYSVKAFGSNSYSIAVERTVAQTGVPNLDIVWASTWVYIFPGTKDPDAVFVFSVTNKLGVSVCWKGVPVKGPDMPIGKWFKISGKFDLGDVKLEPDNKMQIYFWNKTSTDILVDDFYIVFGAPKERPGDSALVDMTTGKPYVHRFNFPPFPLGLVEKDEVRGVTSVFLHAVGDIKEGKITPADKVVAGRFTGNPTGTDDILVIRSGGQAEMFTFCPRDEEFRRIPLEISPTDARLLSGMKVSKGSFTAPGSDQLLLAGEKELILGSFTHAGNPCSGSPACTYRVSSRVPISELAGQATAGDIVITPADLNGDRLSEVLAVLPDGSWKVVKLTGSGKPAWVMIASGDNGPKEWISLATNGSITAGKFLPKYNQDLLLTVFRDGKAKGSAYSLLRFDPAARKFTACFPAKQDGLGKMIGFDTLKPPDRFFFVKAAGETVPEILRYNRDWRFDLKQIRFNDTTFEVIRTIDFHGYEKDHNPKYYEQLELCPGQFLSSAASSFLVVAGNKTPAPYLPDAIGLYSFRNP